MRGRVPMAVSGATVVAVVIIAAVALSSGLSDAILPRGTVVLDQQEIGTYETAYDPDEEVAVDNEYEEAMPFRDPGHISRSEIRLAHALARSGTTKKDETWDFIQPLWGKYIKAMKDPTHVQIGWTNPRHVTEGADYLQTAVERHSYGAEGHREPDRSWDVGEPATGEGFEWSRDLRNGMGMDKPEGFQASMPHMMRERRSEDAKGEGDKRRGKPDRLEIQVQNLHKMLQSEAHSMKGLRDEMRELRAERHSAKDNALRQQLTYKVLKDKLVQSRLKAKVAEEKARQKLQAMSVEETAEIRKMLQVQKDQMASLQGKVTALALAKKSAAKHHHSRLSSKAAQEDLSTYFRRLDRQEAQEEVREAKTKLAKLTGLLGVSEVRQELADVLPRRSQNTKGSKGAVSRVSASKGSKGAKDHALVGAKRSKHRGSLLEATSLFEKGSDEKYGLDSGEGKSMHRGFKALKQQLAIVDTPSNGSNLDSLVQQLKADTTNVAPYLPL